MSRKAHSQSKTLPKPLFKPITDKISGKYKFGLAKSRFNIWNSIDVTIYQKMKQDLLQLYENKCIEITMTVKICQQ